MHAPKIPGADAHGRQGLLGRGSGCWGGGFEGERAGVIVKVRFVPISGGSRKPGTHRRAAAAVV